MTDIAAASPITGKRQTGKVVKWLNHRGIGFIAPHGQDSEVGKDLLVHYSQIKQGSKPSAGEEGRTFKSLAWGQEVEFETATDPKNPDKLIAINVTAVGGGDCIQEDKRFQRRRRRDYAKDGNNAGETKD